MKKVIVILFILLFLFAVIRIGTSTYENAVRDKRSKEVNQIVFAYKELI